MDQKVQELVIGAFDQFRGGEFAGDEFLGYAVDVFGFAFAEACRAEGGNVTSEDLLRGGEAWIDVLGAVEEGDEFVFDRFRGGTGDLLAADAGDKAMKRVDHFGEAGW